jgi:hypothetical protein
MRQADMLRRHPSIDAQDGRSALDGEHAARAEVLWLGRESPARPVMFQSTRAVQDGTGVLHAHDLLAGASVTHISSNSDTTHIISEPATADLLLGRAVGASGHSDRAAPWYAAQRVLQAHYTRRLSLCHYRWASSAAPTLRAAEVHPALRRATAILQQLSTNRYEEISVTAVDSLASAYLQWCPELFVLALPGLVASLALLSEDPATAMPPEDVEAEGGYQLPADVDAVSAQLDAQIQARCRHPQKFRLSGWRAATTQRSSDCLASRPCQRMANPAC